MLRSIGSRRRPARARLSSAVSFSGLDAARNRGASRPGPTLVLLFAALLALPLVGCTEKAAVDGTGSEGSGKGADATDGSKEKRGGEGRSGSRGGGSRGGPPGGFPGGPGGGGGGEERGVPVEIVEAGRRPISLFFETNGALEAENEVDLVARASGPITELATEEGRRVRKGDLLATLDDREIRAQLESAAVRLEETRQSYERVESLFVKELVSQDAHDQALASFQTAQADHDRLDIQLQYTRITAPFSGLVVSRYVKFAEQVQNGTPLFRLSDFDPLLCPIQVPERELSRLAIGQPAEIRVEAYGERRFAAEVLRISPVVDSETGTVKVTLEVKGEGKLRPGMFAKIFLEMENRPDALVVPKAALALDSLGNTVYVSTEEGTAERRDLELGFRNDLLLEVLSGIEEGEQVVVVGQDGLSDGTPIEVLGQQQLPSRQAAEDRSGKARSEETASPSLAGGPPTSPSRVASGQASGGEEGARARGRRGEGRGGAGPFGGQGGRPDFDDPEQVERIKSFMRERGLSDEQIEQRLERMRQRMEEGGGPPGRGGGEGRGGDRGEGGPGGGERGN